MKKIYIILILLVVIGIFGIALIQGFALFQLGVYNPDSLIPSEVTVTGFSPLLVSKQGTGFSSNGTLTFNFTNMAGQDITITNLRITYKGTSVDAPKRTIDVKNGASSQLIMDGMPKSLKGSSFSIDVEITYKIGISHVASGTIAGKVS
jgi:hypothetical protein